MLNKKNIILSLIICGVIGLQAFAVSYKISPNKKTTKTTTTTTPNVYTPSTYTQNNVIRINPTNVVELLMDYSGSMSSWVRLSQNTMQQVIPNLPQTSKVGLRVFGHQRNRATQSSTYVIGQAKPTLGQTFKNMFAGFGGDYCTISDQLYPITSLNSNGLVKAMNNAEIGGSTPLTFALRQTIEKDFAQFGTSQKKKIVLITDGGENCGGNACEYIKTISHRKDIVIDVIIVGSNSFRCLADATGGSYYRVNNQSQFSKALEVSMGTQPDSEFKQVSPNTQTQVQKTNSSGQTYYEFVK